MAAKNVPIILPFNVDRCTPLAGVGPLARAIKASGAVDYVHVLDQMMGWWPPHLWTVENAPLAAVTPDLDSYCDAQALSGYVAASAPGIGLTTGMDAIRRGPAELMQMMLTLANMTEGRTILQLGAGEIKQTAPFGWKRNEGLRRFEDHLRFYEAFWKTTGPVNLSGHFWNFEEAWIGKMRQHRPRVWALGGGPKLIELAVTYADGFATSVPGVISSPERYAEFVARTKVTLESKGRDPQSFDFAPWVISIIHEDPDVVRRAMDNPLIKWFTAVVGRLNNSDWSAYGIESAFPADWHYSTKLITNRQTDRSFVNQILSKVSRRMCELSYVTGSPAEVARHARQYIEAGATHIELIDMLPMILDAEGAQASLARQLETCARIKGTV
jgi:phthiodiolone/phenolphthiodiolone dimycocerosates ketoreductase